MGWSDDIDWKLYVNPPYGNAEDASPVHRFVMRILMMIHGVDSLTLLRQAGINAQTEHSIKILLRYEALKVIRYWLDK